MYRILFPHLPQISNTTKQNNIIHIHIQSLFFTYFLPKQRSKTYFTGPKQSTRDIQNLQFLRNQSHKQTENQTIQTLTICLRESPERKTKEKQNSTEPNTSNRLWLDPVNGFSFSSTKIVINSLAPKPYVSAPFSRSVSETKRPKKSENQKAQHCIT